MGKSMANCIADWTKTIFIFVLINSKICLFVFKYLQLKCLVMQKFPAKCAGYSIFCYFIRLYFQCKKRTVCKSQCKS